MYTINHYVLLSMPNYPNPPISTLKMPFRANLHGNLHFSFFLFCLFNIGEYIGSIW